MMYDVSARCIIEGVLVKADCVKRTGQVKKCQQEGVLTTIGGSIAGGGIYSRIEI